MGLVVFLLAYSTAYAETLTIAHVSMFMPFLLGLPLSRLRRPSHESHGHVGMELICADMSHGIRVSLARTV